MATLKKHPSSQSATHRQQTDDNHSATSAKAAFKGSAKSAEQKSRVAESSADECSEGEGTEHSMELFLAEEPMAVAEAKQVRFEERDDEWHLVEGQEISAEDDEANVWEQKILGGFAVAKYEADVYLRLFVSALRYLRHAFPLAD